MHAFLKKVVKKTTSFFYKKNKRNIEVYDFNKSNPLGNNGERVDIQMQTGFDFDKFDMYQKNHFKRYEFARDIISSGDVCGDFACGTGYGSVLISDKAKKVIGADLDSIVINAIKERYKDKTNITFLNENLLDLKFDAMFDTILSFETIEHFAEEDIKLLLRIFANSLNSNGKLIFSTPYMQEKSEAAIKLGFHLTFYIDESKIKKWLNGAGLKIESFHYQNYDCHIIENNLEKKDFIICVAQKINND
jgi:2-polyprenyl-3-methyl-5-hydroxy-6-metoxy-1,4-benzoquinol methylase